ncbi:MAG TPA: carboxypeptidase-like regulatory domain-containing protein [Candidatus Methanoperedens sp.]|nr:carboxypeptidase-like regulatory domain-containing protein [Candidatus Methanoperedens sp.]
MNSAYRASRRRLAVLCLGLLLLAALAPAPACRQQEQGGNAVLKGRALTPLAEAYLYAYREGMDLRGPAFAVSQASGAEGEFSLTLPPGKYFLVLRRRAEGAVIGPVATGDYHSEVLGPVTIRAGEQVTRDFVAALKVGETKNLPAPGKLPAKTGISGKVFDSDGKPVQGARVQAYQHAQMSERPKYVSEGSGVDGGYALFFPEGGTYYIAARNKFGGPPKIGELYGRYDDGTIEPSAVYVKDGEVLADVNITMHKIW